MTPKSASSRKPSLIKQLTAPSDLSWADGLLLLTILFWGINFSVVKFVLAEMSPLVFNGLRFLFSSFLMVILARFTGRSLKFQPRHLPYLIGLGLLGNTMYQLLFIFGIANTTADNSALILATVPVWVALFATTIVFVFYLPTLTGSVFLDSFLFLVSCHRVSNNFHDLADRYFTKAYK